MWLDFYFNHCTKFIEETLSESSSLLASKKKICVICRRGKLNVFIRVTAVPCLKADKPSKVRHIMLVSILLLYYIIFRSIIIWVYLLHYKTSTSFYGIQ